MKSFHKQIKKNHPIQTKRIQGIILVLLSAFAFYLATFYVKLGGLVQNTSPFLYIFARFAIGFPIFYFFYKKNFVRTVNRKWLYMRAFWNVVAVIMFLVAANIGSAATANFLNMTYPAFVALLAPALAGEKHTLKGWFAVSLTIIGSALILLNGKAYSPALSDLLGWGSGITAAISVISLRQTRKTDSTWTILYYTFRLGLYVCVPLVIWEIFWAKTYPTNTLGWYYLLVSGAWGAFGQLLFTYGFRFVDAVEGSVISSTRILIALIFSYFYFHEELHFSVAVGALAIFAANAYLSIKKRP